MKIKPKRLRASAGTAQPALMMAGQEERPQAGKELIRTARKTTTSTEVKRRYNEKVYGRIYLQLPKETVEAFKAKCNSSGVSQASVLLEAIEKFLRD